MYVYFYSLPVLGDYVPIISRINPFRSYVGPRPTLWFSSSALMSGDVRHRFFCCVCAPAPRSEPVWRFSSCSTDFSQQRAQVVLFLFLGRYAVGRKIGLERVNCISAIPGVCHSVWTTVWYACWNETPNCIPDSRLHRVTYTRCHIETIILLLMGT